MGNDHFCELGADGLHRIQRGLGVLEYHGHGLATQLAPVLFGRGYQIHTVEQDSTALDRAVVGQQAHKGEGQGTLAGPAFAHYAEDLLLFLGKGHAVNRVHRAVGYAKLDVQILDFKERRHLTQS